MSTYSGLGVRDRAKAREMVAHACDLMLAHPQAIHYTQGGLRWQGINDHLRAWQGQYPRYSDCSSSSTWILWQAYLHYGLPDKINGTLFKAGYTGTIANHGKPVARYVKVGDLVLYGQGWPYEHVAVVRRSGFLGTKQPLVFSHGSEAGPFLLPLDYRPDRARVLRFI